MNSFLLLIMNSWNLVSLSYKAGLRASNTLEILSLTWSILDPSFKKQATQKKNLKKKKKQVISQECQARKGDYYLRFSISQGDNENITKSIIITVIPTDVHYAIV